ncbi:MAG TPA: hypothetical protein VJQ54_05175, partial [Candidatus Sulfotelmatobacter sp.]|nr:hypothetical protein [Candidatus Sulfotelmatobacter sp.]
IFLFSAILNIRGEAQQKPDTPASQQPQVKVNMLNVCTPSPEEQKEIASALGRVPEQPLFGTDFEVSRGRSTLTEMPAMLQAGAPGHVPGEPSVASYVRIRREFSVQATFSLVQYSFSHDGQTMVETLVLHVRDPKDLIQVSLEDSASAVTSSEAMLGANTPVNRIRLERFGKSSVALARCQGSEGRGAPDQSAYEPLFRSASQVFSDYRGLLGVKAIVPEELAKIAAKTVSTAKKTAPGTSKMRKTVPPPK